MSHGGTACLLLRAAVEASMRLAGFDLYVPISATLGLPSRKSPCLCYYHTSCTSSSDLLALELSEASRVTQP